MRRLWVSVRTIWAIAVVTALSLAALGAVQTSSSSLTVYFLDVEQGNCILVVSPSGTAAMIDAGTGVNGNGSSNDDPVAFVRVLMDANLTLNLQYVIATHYDADHIGKLDEVLRVGLLGPNGTVFDRGDVESEDDTYTEYEQSIGSHRRVALQPGMTIDLGGGAVLSCVVVNGSYLAPTGIRSVSISQSEENPHSAAFILSYGNVAFWFGGDITSDVEEAVAPYVRDVDVYAADHHGSTTSSCLTLLRALRPEYVVVQSGQENTYGHPNKAVVTSILSVGDSLGSTPRVIYQNHANAEDPLQRSDDRLAGAIADPDGPGPLSGTIVFRTDGVSGVALTIPSPPAQVPPDIYTPMPQPSIEILASASPGSGGTVTGAGTYAVGTQVTLEAAAALGYQFSSWTENEKVISTSATYAFTGDVSRTLVAEFSFGCVQVTYQFDFSTLQPDTLPTFLRQSVRADVASQRTAVEMYEQGWEYTMPVPKSAQAAWCNTDGRTTWWHGYWTNTDTASSQVSATLPWKNECGIYVGDGQDLRNQWRRGGSVCPTMLEWLLSRSSGPTVLSCCAPG